MQYKEGHEPEPEVGPIEIVVNEQPSPSNVCGCYYEHISGAVKL
jgi:hypothetical protein